MVSQTERTPLRDTPKEWADEQFYAIISGLVGAPLVCSTPAVEPSVAPPHHPSGKPPSVDTMTSKPDSSYNYHRYYNWSHLSKEPQVARSAVLELHRIVDSFARERSLEIALFVAHGATQRSSPLALRRGLWVSLRDQYGFPDFARAFEHLVYRSEDGFRKAGVAILSREELAATALGLRKIRSAALLLSDPEKSPDLVAQVAS